MVRIAGMHAPAAARDVAELAIVAIDPQSLRAFPEWPWPRGFYADLVDRLDAAGVRAIGFDIDFSTPRDPTGDDRFAASIQRSGRVVLAAFRQSQRLENGMQVEVASVPHPVLDRSAAGIGAVVVPIDADGVVRRFPRSTSLAGRAAVSLAEASLAVAFRETVEPRETGTVRIDYRRMVPPIPTYSFVDVIEGRIDPRDLAGRIVLVGATAAEFQDLWTTPVGPATPGVWIQAMAARSLAAARAGLPTLRRPSAAAELVLLILLSAGAAWGTRSQRHRLIVLGALAGLGAATQLAVLVRSGWLLDPLLFGGVIVGHYVLGLETIRKRFGRRLAARELSLSTLFRVGEATAGDPAREGAGLDVALSLLGDVIDAEGVAFLRATPSGELDGRRLEWSRTPGHPVGDPATAREVLAGRELKVLQGSDADRKGRTSTSVYLPLRAGETPVGVLVVERRGFEPLGDTELRTVATVGAQLALSAQNLSLLDSLRATFSSSIAAIATAIEARDGYTESHCQRIAIFSGAMATRLGLPAEEIEAIRLGALLHDVGKIGIRDDVLLKAGRLTDGERAEMESHTTIGRGIVASIHGIHDTTLHCIHHHHEHWDGRGYPAALVGEEIPLAARLVTIVDVWDALSTRRPYKPALPPAQVREILEKGRGAHFDPELLDLFLHILDEEGDEMLALIAATTRAHP